MDDELQDFLVFRHVSRVPPPLLTTKPLGVAESVENTTRARTFPDARSFDADDGGPDEDLRMQRIRLPALRRPFPHPSALTAVGLSARLTPGVRVYGRPAAVHTRSGLLAARPKCRHAHPLRCGAVLARHAAVAAWTLPAPRAQPDGGGSLIAISHRARLLTAPATHRSRAGAGRIGARGAQRPAIARRVLAAAGAQPGNEPLQTGPGLGVRCDDGPADPL